MMQGLGYADYDEFLKLGAVETCPACPSPGENIPDNWVDHKYRYGFKYFHVHSIIL